MTWLRRLYKLIIFVGFYLWEMIITNGRVAHDVLTPRHRMQPGILAIPTDAKTSLEILTLSNLLSMTPGTMVMNLKTDPNILYVHVMYLDDVEQTRRQIKDQFERRVLEVLR